MTVLGPPPVRGVGRAGGFKLMVEDRGDLGPEALQAQTENLVESAKQCRARTSRRVDEPIDDWRTALAYAELFENGSEARRWLGKPRTGTSQGRQDERLRRAILAKLAAAEPAFVGLTSVFRANVPQLYVDVNRTECMTKDVALKRPLRHAADLPRLALRQRLQPLRPHLAGDRPGRRAVPRPDRGRPAAQGPQRRGRRWCRSGSLAERPRDQRPAGPRRATTCIPAAPINGSAAPGRQLRARRSTLMQTAGRAANCRRSMAFEWTELAYLELQAGNTAMIIFGFAVVMVFLVLAAQYESWSLPLAVILVVPMCLLSSLDRRVRSPSMDINIFTQIGFVVLVGLASKNAILIVEFAKHAARGGRAAPRGDAGGLPAAAAADRDDVVRVHPRRGAAARLARAPAPRCGGRWARPSSAACSA